MEALNTCISQKVTKTDELAMLVGPPREWEVFSKNVCTSRFHDIIVGKVDLAFCPKRSKEPEIGIAGRVFWNSGKWFHMTNFKC